MIKSCLHCGNDVLKVDDQFCCLGCEAAYQIINKFGFKNYYNLRQIDPKIRKIKPEEDDKILIDEFVNLEKNGNYSVSLMVQGIHCAACVWLIENILKKQESVVKARINLSRKTLFLEWKGSKEQGNEIVSIINKIGYKLLPFDAEIIDAENKKYDDSILKALAVAGFGAGNVMLFSIVLWITSSATLGANTRDLLHFFSALLALPIIIYSSRPFFLSAYKSTKAGYPNMDLAISIAIFLASIVSLLESFRKQEYVYFDSAIMLIFFLLIGRYLDLKARKKAFGVASEFSLLAAGFGKIEIDGKTKIIPSKEIKEGMVLIVSSGEKIVADGFVIDGESEVDASLINGETIPKKVVVNSEVYSGMINLENPVKIKVNKNADKSLLAQIVSLSLEVEETKNHYIRLADRLAKFYTPIVHLIAFLTFIWWFFGLEANWESALMKATAVLIITCPCALALAVPIVQTIAISNFIKKGLLVKSGEALEKLKDIDVVVFDKTGTLTLGKPQLIDVFLLS
ncbi:MAG: HAD-IC family P-type ATPase, partial [Pelagibacterales bacterium]|nr:HAD-IC family P-type ATPase [Pelagibacterales bacterium]